MDRSRTCSTRRPGSRLCFGRIVLAAMLILQQPFSVSASALEAPAHFQPDKARSPADTPEQANLSIETFLDRLMMAESGGRLDAKSPRSTALGPFQFIEATFLEVVRRHFPGEAAGLTDYEILAKRVDADFARRAAIAFTRNNASFLREQGLDVTSVNLRLAFLIGPNGATRLLRADSETPVSAILSSEALAANPFMAPMTAADLVRKAALDVRGNGRVTGIGDTEAVPGFRIRCNLGLASCRRWVALRERILARQASQ